MLPVHCYFACIILGGFAKLDHAILPLVRPDLSVVFGGAAPGRDVRWAGAEHAVVAARAGVAEERRHREADEDHEDGRDDATDLRSGRHT